MHGFKERAAPPGRHHPNTIRTFGCWKMHGGRAAGSNAHEKAMIVFYDLDRWLLA